jgi:hypothetical protein
MLNVPIMNIHGINNETVNKKIGQGTLLVDPIEFSDTGSVRESLRAGERPGASGAFDARS